MFGMLMLFGILMFATSFVAAERYVNYTFYEGTILEDGTFIQSDVPVTDVNASGYVCNDAACSQLGSQIPGLTGNSGTENWMVLAFPDALNPQYGYGIYFYKDGYIDWEQHPYSAGSGGSPSNPLGPYNVSLSKKQGCSADILGVSVLNEIAPNVPLIINVTAELNASVLSAFQSAGPLEAVPSGLEQFYSVQTQITATIYDPDGVVVYQNNSNVNIMAGDIAFVQFEYTPTVEGNYRVVISTDIPDEEEKCLSSQPMQNEAYVAVLEEEPQNMCYTLLNLLSLSSQNPAAGQPVNIIVQKISNSADSLGALTVLPTALEIWIVNQGTGEYVFYNSSIAPANANINDFESFSWEYTPDEGGFYNIVVTGIASDCLLPTNTAEAVTLQAYVTGPHENIAPIITSTPKTIAFAGEKYNYDVRAYDPDNYPLSLTYSLTDSPSGMTINSATGLIEWKPSMSKVGEKYRVTVQVSDGLNSTLQSYDLEVASKGLVLKEEAPVEETQEQAQEKLSVAYAPAKTALIGMPVLTMILLNVVGFVFLILILKFIFASVKIK